MRNEIITCIDCGQKFELTEGWQKLMQEHPEVQVPKRCYACRQKRKREKERERSGNRNFRRDRNLFL